MRYSRDDILTLFFSVFGIFLFMMCVLQYSEHEAGFYLLCIENADAYIRITIFIMNGMGVLLHEKRPLAHLPNQRLTSLVWESD